MGEQILGEDADGRQSRIDDQGRLTVDLFPREIMERTDEIRTRSLGFLATAREKGLGGEQDGDLFDILEEIAGQAFSDDSDGVEGIEEFRETTTGLIEFFAEPETRRAIPFFGIGVFQDSQTGETRLMFAD
jgi:hypothetical protein